MILECFCLFLAQILFQQAMISMFLRPILSCYSMKYWKNWWHLLKNINKTIGKFNITKQMTITGKWHGCHFKKSASLEPNIWRYFLQSFWKSCSNVSRSFEPGWQSISLHFSWSSFVSHWKESRLSGKDLRKSSGKEAFINQCFRCQ